MFTVAFSVPADRRIEQSRLEVRYSPTLAGAMVDALPYLVDFPYGCTEQTLNRFLPTVVTQNVLLKMKLDLKEIEKHQTNLNSQEIGNDKQALEVFRRALVIYPRLPDVSEVAVSPRPESLSSEVRSRTSSSVGFTAGSSSKMR